MRDVHILFQKEKVGKGNIMPDYAKFTTVYLILINLISFFLMGSDKRRAMKGSL